jgi:serine/threonine protein kinase
MTLLKALLDKNPATRPSARDALTYPFLKEASSYKMISNVWDSRKNQNMAKGAELLGSDASLFVN